MNAKLGGPKVKSGARAKRSSANGMPGKKPIRPIIKLLWAFI